jgi:photosystem II stability/assembly factor-like uncharacterized protein
MNIISINLLMLILSAGSFAQENWFVQYSETSANLRDVYFKNEKMGWAVGDSTILKTTDGGLNWVHQINVANYILYDVFFVNNEVGWIAGKNLDPNEWPGVMMKTTNGGNDWEIQLHPYMSFKSIHFVDIDNGWAARIWEGHGIVSKTSDGGLTWSNVDNNNYVVYNSIFFVNKDSGCTVGTSLPAYGNYGDIIQTFNGGTYWYGGAYGGLNFNAIYFADRNNGWVIGSPGKIMKTYDMGSTLFEQSVATGNTLNGVFFINKDIGWIVGDGGIILSTVNSGESWAIQIVGVTKKLNAVYFMSSVDPSPGWIVGDNGLILSNRNGEVLQVDNSQNIVLDEYQLLQNYSNPFNPSTVISYRLPVTSYVTLKVYDALGNEVATLVNEEKPAGEYEIEFNLTSHSGEVRNLTSGIYFYQLRAGDFVQTKKMILLK